MEHHTKRGNVVVVGLMFSTLLGFSALAVDLSMIRVARGQLHNACDAAALSGAGTLDGSKLGVVNAVKTARAIAAENTVMGAPVSLAEGDVEVGILTDGVFQAASSDADPQDINALRVKHVAPDAAPALGSAAFGVSGYSLEAEAMAQRPSGVERAASTGCFLPIAIPDCHLAGVAAGTNPAPFEFKFTSSQIDTVSWGDPEGNPNSNDVRNQLLGQCDHGEISLGDPIYVNEGQHNSALKTIVDILNDSTALVPGTWDGAMFGAIPAQDSSSEVSKGSYGNTLEGPVALVDAGGDCGNLSFVHSKPLTGIAWAVIYDANTKGKDKFVKIQLDLVRDHIIWGETSDDATGPNVFGYGDASMLGSN